VTRIGQNLDAFSWELFAEDMEKVASLDLGHRFTRGFVEG
jgi:diketogulonate reductase-like aldo/keto reductase